MWSEPKVANMKDNNLLISLITSLMKTNKPIWRKVAYELFSFFNILLFDVEKESSTTVAPF